MQLRWDTRERVGGSERLGDPVIRLVSMALAEQDDEWQDGRRYFRLESMAHIDALTADEEEAPALLMTS